MAAKQQEVPKQEGANPWKLLLLVLLAIGCGFLTFNFHYIIQTSHIHISLAHHHKTTAFCAFIGCKLDTEVSAAGAAGAAAGAASAKALTPEQQAAADKLANTTKAMMARVCGSPAIDGYAHVIPKCLEDSPTALWWADYYASGGKQEDLVMHTEQAADYDGLAVKWGLGNKVQSIEECGQQCLHHMPKTIGGPFEKLPCNAFAYCPEEVCFEPDAHKHTKGDCWLKFTEGPAWPEVNMRGELPDWYRQHHREAPKVVQWKSGVLLPKGVTLTNGTFGPRWKW